ncbi:MAG: sugar phosphate isomerase/epimerase, partial [Armatimonadetes bacterium]|nr:sugar phosphate isomerase/epimerase [Armatimonadota bacterium]
LRELAPAAADLGLRIGVENHQDASSEDLAWLCETVDHPGAGVTLDVGNALAVAEHPLEFARRVAPWVVDIHLKDYRLLRSPEGYRLAHCAIGSGVVDFGEVLALFADRPDLPRNIEMAALGERHIRVLDACWWAGHPPRLVSDWLPFVHFWRDGESDGDWRTPFESEPPEAVAAWERARLLESVANLARLSEGDTACASRWCSTCSVWTASWR